MSSSMEVITAQNLSKRFHQQKQRTFKEMLPALLGGKKVVDSFWALKDVSFSVSSGQTLGIIGKNGSGKSTLLKLIAGVSRPTQGNLIVNGKLAPLIELGAGFHPELSGRENVFLNGVILGLTRKYVSEVFDEIVKFSQLEDFIDQPIKHYSSGMYLRLAFAVAVHTNPDILLIDEILAVGDEGFQKKCLQKMKDFHAQGKTIIIVSHSLGMVETFCDRAILLNQGQIVGDGKPAEVVTEYKKMVE